MDLGDETTSIKLHMNSNATIQTKRDAIMKLNSIINSDEK